MQWAWAAERGQVAEQRDPSSGAAVQAKKSSRQSSVVRGPLTIYRYLVENNKSVGGVVPWDMLLAVQGITSETDQDQSS
jgi:hypothetical protein